MSLFNNSLFKNMGVSERKNLSEGMLKFSTSVLGFCMSMLFSLSLSAGMVGAGSVSQDSKSIAGDTTTQEVSFSTVAQKHAKVPLIICFLETESAKLSPLIDSIARDFSFSGQIAVEQKKLAHKLTQKDVKDFFAAGYPLALCVTSGKRNGIEWRLFDTIQGDMIEGKRYVKRGDSVQGWAHNIADSIWPLLTGQEPFFSSRIAYCKQARMVRGKRVKHVCVADYDGTHEQLVVDVPTVTIAPRWNSDTARPLIFYSEYTNRNVRLMSVDMHKKRRIASDFEGINMLPAFSLDGKKVVYCASHGQGHCQLYYGEMSKIKNITQNKGNNISPTLSADGQRVIFCSDYQTGSPQIYVLDIKSGNIERITQGGYCASPSYCSRRGQIAYGKMDKGIMQLYIYDEKKKSHTCLTSDAGSKDDFSWSPCGNYIAFSVEKNMKSRIAVLNLATRERVYITPADADCSYPAWSPLYQHYPHI
jgi:TolB protein